MYLLSEDFFTFTNSVDPDEMNSLFFGSLLFEKVFV